MMLSGLMGMGGMSGMPSMGAETDDTGGGAIDGTPMLSPEVAQRLMLEQLLRKLMAAQGGQMQPMGEQPAGLPILGGKAPLYEGDTSVFARNARGSGESVWPQSAAPSYPVKSYPGMVRPLKARTGGLMRGRMAEDRSL